MFTFCNNDWHGKNKVGDWCSSCGARDDGKTTLCNASLFVLTMGPVRVRSMTTGVERVVRSMGSRADGSTLVGFTDDPGGLTEMDAAALQDWEVIGHETT